MLVQDTLDILPQSADDLQRRHAAVADGGVHIVHGVEAELFQHIGHVLVCQQLLQGDTGALQLRLEALAAVDDVLVPLLPLEPLADFAAGVAGAGDLDPVAAGAVSALAGGDLHHVAVLQPVVQRHDAAVHLGRHHVVAHGGMDVIGKVDGRGAGRQVDHVAVGGEHKHLVGEHVYLQRMDEVLRVGALLILQQAAHPLVAALVAAALSVLLVLPVGGDAVFRHLVHLLGANLYLKGDAALAHHRGVQALVQIGLGGADIVLEPAQNGLEQVVNDAQHVIAVRHRVHDDAEGEQVEHVVQTLVLGVHLAVDGIGVLHAAIHGGLDALLPEPRHDPVVDGGHEPVVLRRLLVQRLGDLPVAHRVEIFQTEVLQLPLHLLHAQPVGDGRVNLHGLEGFLLLLLRRLVLHGAHVVEPVGDFDEDDADVLAHGHQHLPQVLHLLLLLGGVVDAGQLADALHQIGDGGGKQLGQLLVGGLGILNGVVQQRRHNGFAVQMQLLRHDLSHRQRVGHKGRAVLAQLRAVQVPGKLIGLPDLLEVSGGVIAPHGVLQMLIHGLDICGLAHWMAPPPRPVVSASARRCMYTESSRWTFLSFPARCSVTLSPCAETSSRPRS